MKPIHCNDLLVTAKRRDLFERMRDWLNYNHLAQLQKQNRLHAKLLEQRGML